MRRIALTLGTLLIASTFAAAGCVTDSETGEALEGKPEADGKIVDGKADAWNSTNNPERFNVEFDYALKNMPAEGKADVTPWPDTYWPTYKDSSNQRWQGVAEMSPLEKYDLAFNGWTPPEGFMDLRPWRFENCVDGEDHFDPEYYDALGPAAAYQSQYKGNAKARDGIDNDNDGKTDECDDRDGVESWWGLCHAWVPAAILEAEPVNAVTYNGVTFDVGDIKALLIGQYDRASAFMLGGRCNEKEVERDEEGRLTQPQCRDTNAGAFHVTLTNMLGRYKRSFAEDRTYNYEVWNQPMYDYKVLSQESVDMKAAMAELGVEDATSYTFNDKAVKWVKVRTTVRYLAEPSQSTTYALVPEVEADGRHLGTDTYDYILELDEDENVIGGEWSNYSQTSHPDFLWLPTGSRGGNPKVSIDKVRMLLGMSTAANPPAESEIETFESTDEIDIPDNDPAGITSTIVVDKDITIGSLKATLDVDHTYRGDLRVTLEKDGTTIVLHDREGAGADDIKRNFDVEGFGSESAKGTWTLKIVDLANLDKGTLRGWSLTVSNQEATAPGEHAATDLPISIPDNDGDGITSTIDVTEGGSIESLKVKIGLTHTYIGDLRLALTHGGITKTLHSREGGSSDDIEKTFSVEGFDGSSLKGEWTLKVSDHAGQDIGTLNSFSLLAVTN